MSIIPEEIDVFLVFDIVLMSALLLFFILTWKQQTRAKAKLENDNSTLEQRIEARTQELQEKELFLHTVLDNAISGIIIIDSKGIITSFNKAAETIFQYQAEEVIGRNVSILMPDSIGRQHDAYLNNYLKTGEAKIIGSGRDTLGRRKKGEYFPVHLGVAVVEANNKKVFIGTLQDISKQKQIEVELLQHRNHLQDLVNEQTIWLQEARYVAEMSRQKAERANQLKTEFLANMSHELRTPMHAIIGFAELGKMNADRWGKEENLANLEEIHDSGNRLLTLLNDLLDLSKLEAHVVDFDIQKNDMKEVVEKTIHSLKPIINKKRIHIESLYPDSLPHILEFDKKKVTQVIWNLLSNAIKFSPEQGSISIECKHTTLKPVGLEGSTEDAPGIEIAVVDKGVGIPEDELESVFDKFVQSRKTKTDAGGTGLGLAICKEIIEGHYGNIWAENNADGVGTRVMFTIPLARPILEEKRNVA